MSHKRLAKHLYTASLVYTTRAYSTSEREPDTLFPPSLTPSTTPQPLPAPGRIPRLRCLIGRRPAHRRRCRPLKRAVAARRRRRRPALDKPGLRRRTAHAHALRTRPNAHLFDYGDDDDDGLSRHRQPPPPSLLFPCSAVRVYTFDRPAAVVYRTRSVIAVFS